MASIFFCMPLAFAQNFLPYATSNILEGIVNGEVIDNNSFYVLNNYNALMPTDTFIAASFNGLVSDLPIVNYRYNNLKILDYDLNVLHSKNLTSTTDSIYIYSSSYFDTNKNEITLLGYVKTANAHKRFIEHYDLSLNRTKQLFLDLPSDTVSNANISSLRSFTTNINGNYLINDFNGVFEIDTNGQIVFNGTNFLYDNKCLQLASNNYLQHSGDVVFFYDQNFSQTGYSQFTNSGLIPFYGTFSLTKSKVKYFEESGNLFATGLISHGFNNPSTYELVVKYNINTTFDEIIFEELPQPGINDNLRISSIFGFDAINEDHLYLTNSYNFCGIIGSTISPEPCDSAFVTLTHINGDGTVYWRKILGGDAAYASLGLIPTADFGVILFVLRRSYNDNYYNDYDTYYLKFDEFGNVVDTTTNINQPQISIYDVLVNPNPASDYLQFQYHLPNANLQMQVYNLDGKLLISKAVENNKLDIKKLPTGNYSFILKNNNQFLQKGKFVKF